MVNAMQAPTAATKNPIVVSVTSKAAMRYEGHLRQIDETEKTITLVNVRSMGTENRPCERQAPASSEVYEFITFKCTDITKLHMVESNKDDDTAIIAKGRPRRDNSNAASRLVAEIQRQKAQRQLPERDEGFDPYMSALRAGLPPIPYLPHSMAPMGYMRPPWPHSSIDYTKRNGGYAPYAHLPMEPYVMPAHIHHSLRKLSASSRANTAKLPPLPCEDFDFEAAHAKFAQLDDTGNEKAPYGKYDPSNSFFDNITTDADQRAERSRLHGNDAVEQPAKGFMRKMNEETFGTDALQRFYITQRVREQKRLQRMVRV